MPHNSKPYRTTDRYQTQGTVNGQGTVLQAPDSERHLIDLSSSVIHSGSLLKEKENKTALPAIHMMKKMDKKGKAIIYISKV